MARLGLRSVIVYMAKRMKMASSVPFPVIRVNRSAQLFTLQLVAELLDFDAHTRQVREEVCGRGGANSAAVRIFAVFQIAQIRQQLVDAAVMQFKISATMIVLTCASICSSGNHQFLALLRILRHVLTNIFLNGSGINIFCWTPESRVDVLARRDGLCLQERMPRPYRRSCFIYGWSSLASPKATDASLVLQIGIEGNKLINKNVAGNIVRLQISIRNSLADIQNPSLIA